MRKNVLAANRNDDVITHSACKRLGVKAWAIQSTQTNSSLSRKLPENTVTILRISLGSLLLASSKRGDTPTYGSQVEKFSRPIPRMHDYQDDQLSESANVNNAVEKVENSTYYLRRDGKVLKHFPTAKPSATVLAVARDLYQIVCMLLNCASSAQSRVRLASSAELLRRFALTCKEGARHD